MVARDLRNHAFGLAAAVLASLWIFSTGTGSNRPAGFPPIQVKEVASADAKALIDAGALVVDVRSAEAFAAHHVAGAIHIPLDEMHAAVAANKVTAARDKPIVVYCGDGARSGPEGTAILNAAGFVNAVNLKGGLEGWQKAGMPTEAEVR